MNSTRFKVLVGSIVGSAAVITVAMVKLYKQLTTFLDCYVDANFDILMREDDK